MERWSLLMFPRLTEERRIQLVKQAKAEAEEAKISVQKCKAGS